MTFIGAQPSIILKLIRYKIFIDALKQLSLGNTVIFNLSIPSHKHAKDAVI